MAKDIDMSRNVHGDLVTYVYENLPRTLDNDIEKAIGIYMLVCNVLKYDPDYVIYGDFDRINDFEDVTRTNNNVVCYTVSAILYKLFNLFGVKAILHGNLDGHMYVSLEIDDMIIMFDPTRSGYYDQGYNMSDLANIKFGLMPNGIVAMPYGAEIDKIKDVKIKCRNSIKSVYKKMGLKTNKTYRLNCLLDRIYNAEEQRDVIFDEEGIRRNVRYVSSFKFLENSDIENVQFLNKILSSIFRDIWDERAENITLYNESYGEIRVSKLVVLYDDELKPMYYWFRDGRLKKYDVDTLYQVMVDEGWYFRYPTDIDALNIEEDEKINKLYIH